MKAIKAFAQKLKEDDPQYGGFADKLIRLAVGFKDEELLRLTKGNES